MEQTQIEDALCRRLIAAALEARKRSYAPYSHYHVGAALWTQSGKLYTGCNIENGAYGPSCCAERVAFFTALAAGKRTFSAIAVAGGAEGTEPRQYCPPCGVCRQVMAEFCGDDFPVILVKGKEETIIRTLGELLPERFHLAVFDADTGLGKESAQ